MIPPSPSPAPSPESAAITTTLTSVQQQSTIHPLQLFLLNNNSIPDLTTISFISTLLLLSLFSIFFIIHFRLKTHQSQHLKDFNSLWTVRILFVTFISLWALNDLTRLPSFPPQLIPFNNNPNQITLTQKINLCKTHVVLSHGLFEPGFLITLLFLVNISVMKRNPKNALRRALTVVTIVCLPLLTVLIFFLFYASRYFFPPEILWRSFVVYKSIEVDDDDVAAVVGDDKVLCTYPLISTITFGAFAISYLMFFALACCRVVSLVINKGLRVRIYLLACTVLVTVPVQLLFLVSSAFWRPGDVAFDGIGLVVFLCVLLCAVVGEGILVIRPIADALAVGGELYRPGIHDSRL